MTTPAPPARLIFGILCMMTAGVMFSGMGGIAKLLGETYSSLQVSWARAAVHLVFLAAVFMPRGGLAVLRSRRPGLQLTRAVMLTCSNLCFFYAITFIPLAKASAISLAAPLIVTLLAWPMLGERTTPMRIAAVLTGFLGVIVVIRPGGELFHWASFFVLGSATAYGVYQVLTRRVAPFDPPATSALWAPLTGAVGLLAVLPFVWIAPAGPADLALFFGCGALGATGHYFVARAFTYAPANIVSPFQYFQLLSAVAVGWAIFGDVPDAATWVGAAVIVAAGLWLGWAQRR